MRSKKKFILVILGVVFFILIAVYFGGPKTNYSGVLRLYYNFVYIFTPCPLKTYQYEDKSTKFSYKSWHKFNVEKYENRIHLSKDEINFWMPHLSSIRYDVDYERIKKEHFQRRDMIIKTGNYICYPDEKKCLKVPDDIREKLKKDGITLQSMPYLLEREVFGETKEIKFNNEIKGILFEQFNKGWTGIDIGTPPTINKALIVLFPDGRFYYAKLFPCKNFYIYNEDFQIIKTFWDMYRDRRFMHSQLFQYFPSPMRDKLSDCLWESITKTLEFKDVKK